MKPEHFNMITDLPTPGGRNQGVFPSKSGILDINQGVLP